MEQSFSRKKAIIVFAVTVLVVATLTIGLQRYFTNKPAIIAGFGSSDIIGNPLRLKIPAINVDAKIQQVGVKKNGELGIPTNFTDVGWYNLGTIPGAMGTAVIDGHLDGRNSPRAVFYDLGKLKVGDIVEVTDSKEKVMKFKVVDSKLYETNATTTEVFLSDGSKARLNLITCAGDWNKEHKIYNQRIVVFTERVE